MQIDKIKIKLKIILKNITEFRQFSEVRSPKVEYEKLFNDFSVISKELQAINPELFDDLNTGISFLSKNVRGLYDNYYNKYEGSQLELLLMEVEKAINYISILEKDNSVEEVPSNPQTPLNIIADRFHQVVKQIRKRHNSAPTLDVKNEYDVQDLYHGLLKLFFDDIRPESYVPEYAGGNSRIDFVLKKENIAIEIKKSRETLKSKELGEQLIIDIERYKNYPDIDTLHCFVYDPDGWIDNPNGIENDLSGVREGLNVVVRIEPK